MMGNDICQDCPYFLTKMDHVVSYDGAHMIYISCEHSELCNHIRKHIEIERRKRLNDL